MVTDLKLKSEFYEWLVQRKSLWTAKHYDYWYRRLLKETGEISTESILWFYDRHPKTIVRGMLNNLCLYYRVSVPLPKVRRTKSFKLPQVYDEEFKVRLVESMIPRYRSVLWLMAETGVRISEAVSIRLIDINVKERKIKIKGKGGRERIINPSDDLIDALIKEYHENKNPLGYIFPSYINIGEPIRPHTIRKHLRKIVQGAKPHTFRHTFATLVYRKTKNLRLVQNMLGHTNIATTAIYTHLVDEEKAEAAQIAWLKK